jgi:hypothetical protein
MKVDGDPMCLPCANSQPANLPRVALQDAPLVRSIRNTTAAAFQPKLQRDATRIRQPIESDMPKCAVADCENRMGRSNITGRCSPHYYVKVGTLMRDGSRWRSAEMKHPKSVEQVRAEESTVALTSDEEEAEPVNMATLLTTAIDRGIVPHGTSVPVLAKVGDVAVISIANLPKRKSPTSRFDAIVGSVFGLEAGKAIAYRESSPRSAQAAAREIRKKCKAMGLKVHGSTKGDTAYIWREQPAAVQA